MDLAEVFTGIVSVNGFGWPTSWQIRCRRLAWIAQVARQTVLSLIR